MSTATAEQLAALFGVSSEVVRSLARRGIVIKKPGANCFALAESVRAYCGHLRELAHGRKTGDTPAADRSRLWGKGAGTREAVRRSALLDAGAVEAEWIGVARTIRAGVLRLPRRAGARLGLSPEQVRELDAEIREVLTNLGTEGSRSRHDEAAATAGD